MHTKRGGWILLLITLITSINIYSVNAQNPPPTIQLQQITSGLQLPLYLTHDGTNNGILYIVEKTGRIKRINSNTGAILSPNFIDINSQVCNGFEQGLLGLAFHPNFASNGYFYIYYTGPASTGGDLFLKRCTASGNPPIGNPTTCVTMLQINHPGFTSQCGGVHNGGWIGFGPDNYLYVAVGNGGYSSVGNPIDPAPQLNSLLGKILRLDINNPNPPYYSIPSTNPFVSSPGALAEIWAKGLRNPWRASFDKLTGNFFIGDVGQNSWEEINFQPNSMGGQDFAWSSIEGCFNQALFPQFTAPIHCYPHISGLPTNGFAAVTGGYFYRGSQYPQLYNRYYFGDSSNGYLWSLVEGPIGTWTATQHLGFNNNLAISSFGEDQNGELYITSLFEGKLYKITATNPVVFIPSIATTSNIGTTIPITISAPSNPNKPYILAISLGMAGIPLPGGLTLQLTPDAIFFASISPPYLGMINSIGNLNSIGNALIQLPIPYITSLNGLTVYIAFAVLDTLMLSFIEVSPPYPLILTL